MELIPVLDLMGGVVVHARRGERDSYRPIETPLCPGADPLAIAGALLRLAPFRTFYIADLDAIRGIGGHDRVIGDLRARFPSLDIWVDAGEADPVRLRRRRDSGLGRPVIGTEAMGDCEQGRAALAAGPAILSLDHDAGGPLGPRGIHDRPDLWPEEVIVMTLARVGAGHGPDIERLREVRAKAGDRRVFAAGGVRDDDDLQSLADMGVAGVLLASALHDGRIGPAALSRFTP